MATIKYILAFLLVATSLISCSNPSLQKYLVEKQDDPDFVKFDLATSMLEGKNSNFSEEDKAILKTIKKINIVAYPIKDGDSIAFESERKQLETILAQDQYKDLTRIKSKDWNATLKYSGDEEAVDEVIVFASDNSKGFAVFRVLGNNMRPDQILQLVHRMDDGDMDLSKLTGLSKIFKD